MSTTKLTKTATTATLVCLALLGLLSLLSASEALATDRRIDPGEYPGGGGGGGSAPPVDDPLPTQRSDWGEPFGSNEGLYQTHELRDHVEPIRIPWRDRIGSSFWAGWWEQLWQLAN